MAHIDENFPLPVLLNPILSEENRNNPLRNRDADAVPPRQLVLEPRLAEDLVRRSEEPRLPGQTPVQNLRGPAPNSAEPEAAPVPTPAELPPAGPDQANPDILGVQNEESLDIGVPRRFVENFQADLRDELALEVLQAPQVLEPETPVVPAATNPVPPPAGTPPEPTGVEALNQNPAPLRPDSLATDPALRANRAQRNILQEVDPVLEVNPNAEVNRNPETNPNPETEAPGPVNPLLENIQPAPLLEVQTPAVNEALENRPEDLQEILRPEEELQAPPPPRNPETVITERGQNVDRLI